MKSRKGMDMSIIAALGLIVLIVLILIFTGQIGKSRFALNKTSTTYSGDTCEVPGTSRTCRTEGGCNDIGGFIDNNAKCLGFLKCCSV